MGAYLASDLELNHVQGQKLVWWPAWSARVNYYLWHRGPDLFCPQSFEKMPPFVGLKGFSLANALAASKRWNHGLMPCCSRKNVQRLDQDSQGLAPDFLSTSLSVFQLLLQAKN